MKRITTLGLALGLRRRDRRARPRPRSSSASPGRSPAAAPPSARSSRTASSRRSPTSTPPAASSARRSRSRSATTLRSEARRLGRQQVRRRRRQIRDRPLQLRRHHARLRGLPGERHPRRSRRPRPIRRSPSASMWNIFRTCGRDDQQGAVAGDYILKNFKGKKIAIVHDKTTYGQGLADETKQGDQQRRPEGSALRRRQHRRQGLLRAGVEDQGVGRRPRLLGRLCTKAA